MMPADLTSSDSEVLDSTETPQKETPRTCTRQTPGAKPTCFTCLSPSNGNHVRNLTTALNRTTSTTTVNTCPAPPTNHWISELIRSFQDAILINDVRDLKHLNTFYDRCMVSEPDILKFDLSQLLTTLELAQKTIDSSISPSSTSTQLSDTPPPSAGLNLPGWKFLDGLEKITNSTPGYLPVPQVLKSPNAPNQPEPN